ncbi:hypothetical protein RJ55_06550 [Drechmeria coniospora]|nr:hypothetical protein RJ55_06550 [Drechmeria coniospora]
MAEPPHPLIPCCRASSLLSLASPLVVSLCSTSLGNKRLRTPDESTNRSGTSIFVQSPACLLAQSQAFTVPSPALSRVQGPSDQVQRRSAGRSQQ